MTPEFSSNEELSRPADPAPVAETPAEVTQDQEVNADDYVFVKMPNGQVLPVPKSQIQDAAPETVKPDAVASNATAKEPQHYYVHTANGDVIRVDEEDLPQGQGTNAPFGHWVKDGKSHVVIGVYPVETTVGQ